MNDKIKIILDISKKVMLDSALENGAIVAANATKDYYPSTAKNYFYVWPRDASYTCIAADLVGIDGIQQRFFKWCLNRAEGFRDKGLFFEKYYVNGLKALSRFQPDQTGSVLYALWHHYRKNPDEAMVFEELIRNAADGLCSKWNKDHFNVVTNDLWEERLTFPDLKENFSYSLAACIKGLECANALIENSKWLIISEQMRSQLDRHFVDSYFVRSLGEKIIDKRIDSSVLGLVYPFEVYKANDSKIKSTIRELENRLVIDGGVHRYEFDEYDGWMYEEMHRKKGAGSWPLLNFWLAIYYSQIGDTDKSNRVYNWVLDKVDNYIPEQIFDNDIQISISPLVWSHSMFIISSRYLNYI